MVTTFKERLDIETRREEAVLLVSRFLDRFATLVYSLPSPGGSVGRDRQAVACLAFFCLGHLNARCSRGFS